MMQSTTTSKVTTEHLSRNAYLYVRQSTLRQVVENTESTKRQYGLRQRAVALGWSDEQIVVIDKDLGRSAASASDREGFGELVAEVGMGRAGIVLGLEVSRLARNNTDWHHLLEICALFKTLILDEDGIYDPAHFNDRLLLGLKGTMSEAELHVLRARLRGGILNKARRGELRCKLPIGFVYDAADRVVLDPDVQVQESIRLLFATFERTGAGCATVKHFTEEQLRFPLRPDSGPHKGEILWQRLGLKRALTILHNPRYAGAYVYGRRRTITLPGGRTRAKLLPRDEWVALQLDAHPGYISWANFERNQKHIEKTAMAFGQDRRHGPPREGPALLQGLAVCGVCGTRMSVRYRRRHGRLLPTYTCHLRAMDHREPTCQVLHGEAIDAAIGDLLVGLMTPMALELSLAVQEEIRERLGEADRLRRMQVESAQYEVDLARQRYMQVDPSRRLVADSLEASWNEKLRTLESAREEYQRGRDADQAQLDDQQRRRILELTQDFPALWNDPATSHRERKRMTALLIQDVTLTRRDTVISLDIRFRGGRTQSIEVPAPIRACDLRRTRAAIVTQIDALLDDEHTDGEIATILNERGLKTGAGEPFMATSVQWVRYASHLASLRQRLRAKGMLTSTEIARHLATDRHALMQRLHKGELRARKTNDNGRWVFWPLDQQPAGVADATTSRKTAANDGTAAKGAV
jgi:DNA invertase Pin-like site-specific DNA recombinase